MGLGLITGAADDDPSAVGTYAAAGAALGPAFLWTAPALLPMMVAVVYLSSKLGQVTGRGLFEVLRLRYARWIVRAALAGVIIGNTIEASADIGGIAAATTLLVPLPPWLVLVLSTAAILALQIWGSYATIRNIFRFLALALLAYVGSAVFARPDVGEVIRGTLVPQVSFTPQFMAMIVAVIGTSLSAYLFTWQSNEEVEEEISIGRRRLADRVGATPAEIRHSAWDVMFGMFFSNLVMYFVILAASATLFRSGRHDITSAAQAADALRPMAGRAASALFAAGIIGVGFLAVPVMTAGAAYDVCQVFGWRDGLHAPPSHAPHFYAIIVVLTGVALGMNFLGINPMKALVLAGIVQGFSTPPLLLLIMIATNDRRVMGEWINGRLVNVLGWATTVVVFAATAGLVVSWLR